MAKRANPRGCQLVRGFLLGMLYAQGKTLTTARIRRELRVSQATAKRDMKAIRKVVLVRPSKPFVECKNHQPQATMPLKKAA
jgi:DNA-binding transcriptional regulator GbsR (MarR family)